MDTTSTQQLLNASTVSILCKIAKFALLVPAQPALLGISFTIMGWRLNVLNTAHLALQKQEITVLTHQLTNQFTEINACHVLPTVAHAISTFACSASKALPIIKVAVLLLALPQCMPIKDLATNALLIA